MTDKATEKERPIVFACGPKPTCPVCETWGAPIREDGAGCGNCYGPDPQSPPRFNA